MTDCERIVETVTRAVVGKDRVVIRGLLAILAGGHILLEDIPGVGKTTLALAFSKALGLEYNRVQFTPDVLPSDVTGFSVYNKETGRMDYKPGPVLCNLFLADELNRATSRTQSALLEAMEEGQVTVDSVSHPIPSPFIVIATQNPAGAAGTQLLPDSQLDRFMVRLSLGYPDAEDEVEMLRRSQEGNLLNRVEQAVSREGLLSLRHAVERVYVSPDVMDYLVRLVAATRSHPHLLQGASPRATLALTSMAKSMAFLQGRDYMVPKDIAPVFVDTLSHRLLLRPEAANSSMTAESILKDLFRSVAAPRMTRTGRG